MINPERLYLLDLSTAAHKLLYALIEQANAHCKQKTYRRYRQNFELLELGSAFEKAGLPTLDCIKALDDLKGQLYFRIENYCQISIEPDELYWLILQAWKDHLRQEKFKAAYRVGYRKGQALRARNLSEMEDRYISSLVVTPKGVLERHIKPY